MRYSIKRSRRRWRCAILVLSMLLGLSGCGSSSWTYNPITDVNNLEGRRVGVNLSWESDYFLSDRTDMELCRYDSTADMILALRYDKVDAIAMDEIMWKKAASQSSGLARTEEPVGTVGYILYFSRDSQALAEDFNEYLDAFKTTPEYSDYIAREKAFDGQSYNGPEIPLTGTGPVVRLAIDAETFPRCFQPAGADVPTGFDLEIFKRFANDRGYQIQFTLSNYDDACMGLLHGVYDVAAGYFSDVYREEVEDVGLFTSHNLDQAEIVFVEKTQADFSVNLDVLP